MTAPDDTTRPAASNCPWQPRQVRAPLSVGGIKLGPAAAVQRLVTCLKNHGWNPYTQPRPHVTHRTQSAQRLRLTHPRSSPREST